MVGTCQDRFSRLRYSASLAILLGLVLLRLPHLIASGLNNLASLNLLREWQVVAREIELPQCQQRLPISKAEPYIRLALELAPTYQRAWLNSGRVAWLEGRCNEAGSAWENALRLSCGDRVAGLLRFFSLYAVGHAEPWLAMLRSDQVCSYAFYTGLRAEREGRQGAALAWYEMAFAQVPERRVADRLAPLYVRDGKLDDGIATWERVADALPETDADHWWALGQAAELAQEWEQAAVAYETGVTLSDKPYDFWMRAGTAYGWLNWAQAERAFYAALDARPDQIWPYLGLGHARLNQKDYEGALAWYRRAEEMAPQNLSSKYYLSFLYYTQQDYPQARRYFEAVLQIDAKHAWSMYYLAQSMYRMQDQAEAIQTLDQAIRLNPAKPWDWAMQLGDWQLEAGDKKAALESYQLALEWHPGDEEILEWINRLTSP